MLIIVSKRSHLFWSSSFMRLNLSTHQSSKIYSTSAGNSSPILVGRNAHNIFSLHIPTLPFVFVLEHSWPSPTYLHAAYTRATLSLLRISAPNIPNTQHVMDDILLKVYDLFGVHDRSSFDHLKTFADPNFEPDIYIGPGSLGFIADYTTRHAGSARTLIHLLKVRSSLLRLFKY